MREVETKFSFYYDQTTGIFYKTYHGEIRLIDIIESWEYLISNEFIPLSRKGFIVDLGKAQYVLKESEYPLIPRFYNKYPEIFHHCKMAIITETPLNVIVPILIRELDGRLIHEPFTTCEMATQWVLSNIL